jgi:peptide/nickel transport system substrate-binding protein
VRISALRAGDVDFIILVPESEIERLKTQETGTIETSISREGIFWWFPFNHTRPPFDDPKLRKAAQLAFEARPMAEAVTLGQGAPYEQPHVTGSRWHFDTVELPQRNLEMARQLLAETGHADGLKVRLLIASSWYGSMGPAAQVLQAQLGEVGIQVELENTEFGTYIDKAVKMDYDLLLSGWEVEPWDPDDYFFNVHTPDASQWFYGGKFNNAEYTGIVTEARGEQDVEKRKALYQQAEGVLQREAAGIFGYRLSMGFAWRTTLKGFTPSLRGDVAHVSGGIYAMSRA